MVLSTATSKAGTKRVSAAAAVALADESPVRTVTGEVVEAAQAAAVPEVVVAAGVAAAAVQVAAGKEAAAAVVVGAIVSVPAAGGAAAAATAWAVVAGVGRGAAAALAVAGLDSRIVATATASAVEAEGAAPTILVAAAGAAATFVAPAGASVAPAITGVAATAIPATDTTSAEVAGAAAGASGEGVGAEEASSLMSDDGGESVTDRGDDEGDCAAEGSALASGAATFPPSRPRHSLGATPASGATSGLGACVTVSTVRAGHETGDRMEGADADGADKGRAVVCSITIGVRAVAATAGTGAAIGATGAGFVAKAGSMSCTTARLLFWPAKAVIAASSLGERTRGSFGGVPEGCRGDESFGDGWAGCGRGCDDCRTNLSPREESV